MDVRCNRCATEYEFDDALISERGTTVKCTNCGFQFKVFPADARALAPERWVVRTSSGRELVFTSLGELQRAIAEHRVGANDVLSRGQQPPRPLGSIAELEPFFLAPRSSQRMDRTLQGVAPVGAVARSAETPAPPPVAPIGILPVESSLPRTESYSGRQPATAMATSEPSREPWRTERIEPAPVTPRMPYGTPAATERVSPARGGLTPTPLAGLAATMPSVGAEPPSTRGGALNVRGSQPNLRLGQAVRGSQPNLRMGSQPELGAELRSNPRGSSPIGLPPPSSRRDLRSYDELSPELAPDPTRRARSRWIAAVVILGVLTLFALTVGRRYLLQARTSSPAPTEQSNAKVAALLKAGNRFLDEGNLEEAGEELTKASALAERDPEVLAALARLSVLRADTVWLKLRLIDPKAVELVQATRRDLGRLTGKARTTVESAFGVAPENMVVLRARVDALRLSGDHDAARDWIKPIASQPADPENAYVLAALDLAEAEPSWPTVIERLKLAATGERTPGRANVALVYALAKAGRLDEAEAELTRLEASPGGALSLDELRSFVKRQRLTAGDEKSDPSPKPTASADAKDLERAADARPAPAAAAPVTGDFRRRLELAAQAVRRNELARAEELYEQVLAQRPGNTEAIAGLGDIARRRNDPATAKRMYDKVLAENPNYLPALIANADQKWDAGDRAGAVALYRRVVAQVGARGEYGQRASSRIAQAEAAEQQQPAERPSDSPYEEDSPAPEDAPAPAPDSPHIDTTDLPELK